jgi:predicted DNA-binding transcriptional regulator AlpA
MGFNVKPISRVDMKNRVCALDADYRAELERKLRARVNSRFSMSDLVVMTGRAQEHLINLEKDGKIPRARRIGKKRFYRWPEDKARMIIAIVQALPHKK